MNLRKAGVLSGLVIGLIMVLATWQESGFYAFSNLTTNLKVISVMVVPCSALALLLVIIPVLYLFFTKSRNDSDEAEAIAAESVKSK